MASPWSVLIDRDGTFIMERNYVLDPESVELIPGAAELMLCGSGI